MYKPLASTMQYLTHHTRQKHNKTKLITYRPLVGHHDTNPKDVSVVDSGGETPGPIPNPEAKPTRADGTALGRVWESKLPPA